MVTLFLIAALCVFLLLELHHSLTHDCMGRKIKPPANSVYKNPVKYVPSQNGRFLFSESTVREKIGKIAERFKLEMKYTLELDPLEIPDYIVFLTDKSEKNYFKINISDDCISIISKKLDSYDSIYYTFRYSFDFFDDAFGEQKAHKYTESDHDFEHIIFSSSIMFDNLSDDEIFAIIEKIIEALYGAAYMTYETAEAEDGKESFTFYLDAPDYYGYTETTEIGNFKFILNKENGGDKNV